MASAEYEWKSGDGSIHLKQDDESNVLTLMIMDDRTENAAAYHLDRAQATQLAQALVILQEFL